MYLHKYKHYVILIYSKLFQEGFLMKNNVSNETALSVRSDKPLVVSDGTVKSNPASQPQQKQTKKKKKSPVVAIIIILAVLLVLAAAGFFGYKYYTNKVSEEILNDLTGTWVYDTATSDAGYMSFFGNDEVLIDGTTYNITASKTKLTLTAYDDTKAAIEYSHVGDELLLALGINNDYFESCEVTVSGTDAGVMLYRIDSNAYLDDVEILEKYYEQFPQYAVSDYLDSIVDWDSLEDIIGGDFSYEALEDYLGGIEDSESLESFITDFIIGDSSSDEATDDFDLSDLLTDYISGYIGDFGNEAGDYVGDAVDGSEIEEAADVMYDIYEFYNAITDEDASEEDILGAIGDLFGW